MLKRRMTRTKWFVLGISLFASSPGLCLFLVVLWHDYHPPKSDLASLDGEQDVRAVLEKDLILHQSSEQDVLAVLDKHHVEGCKDAHDASSLLTSGATITSSIPTYARILETGELILLFTIHEYQFTFSFVNGKLDRIDVDYFFMGP